MTPFFYVSTVTPLSFSLSHGQMRRISSKSLTHDAFSGEASLPSKISAIVVSEVAIRWPILEEQRSPDAAVAHNGCAR
jgi:hypothetical protein